jgi:hypothetical protein
MNKALTFALAACALAAAARIPASAQSGTAQPGQPTQAKVWVQNRGSGEALPVSIERVASPVAVRLTEAAKTTAARQAWEYRRVIVPPGDDPVPPLNAAGADGWEATGVYIPMERGILILMKRPRQ